MTDPIPCKLIGTFFNVLSFGLPMRGFQYEEDRKRLKKEREFFRKPFKFLILFPLMIKTTLTAVVIAAFAIVAGIFVNAALTFATSSVTNSLDTSASGPPTDIGGNKWSQISSIQNYGQGRPGWVVAGH